jgi:predicted transcriptional regulator of viral defense system
MDGVEAKTVRGAVRLRALRLLYENTEDGRVYARNKLLELLVGNGVNENTARLLIWDFYLLGILERLKPGLYKVNKVRLKEYMAEIEATLISKSKL